MWHFPTKIHEMTQLPPAWYALQPWISRLGHPHHLSSNHNNCCCCGGSTFESSKISLDVFPTSENMLKPPSESTSTYIQVDITIGCSQEGCDHWPKRRPSSWSHWKWAPKIAGLPTFQPPSAVLPGDEATSNHGYVSKHDRSTFRLILGLH